MDSFFSQESDDVYCCRKKSLLRIKEKLPLYLKNPRIEEFLQNSENEAVFKTAIETLQEEDIQKLDDHFKEFMRMNRAIRYFSGAVKRIAIDIDKRNKKRNDRYQRIIDKPINNGRDGSNVTMKEMIDGGQKTPDQILEYKEDQQKHFFMNQYPGLREAVEEILEPKVHQILYLKYEVGFTNKEIGARFGQTEQNIGHLHRKALKQLKKALI